MTWARVFLRALLLVINLHLPGSGKLHLPETERIHRELEREERKKKLRRKQLPKRRERFVKKRIYGKYTSTKPKDHRYSDQRKLRRMYRNS